MLRRSKITRYCDGAPFEITLDVDDAPEALAVIEREIMDLVARIR